MTLRLEVLSANSAKLLGDIDVHSAAQIVAQGQSCITQASGEWRVDLLGVERASSAAVALLLEWLRSARKQNKAFYIENLPAPLLPILRISDLEPFFAPLLRPGQ